MDRSYQGMRTKACRLQLVSDGSEICSGLFCFVYNQGPSETPFEGGVFQLAFSVPEQYPLQPPQVRFLTKIFHPNVHFKVGWIPVYISLCCTGTFCLMKINCMISEENYIILIYLTIFSEEWFLIFSK